MKLFPIIPNGKTPLIASWQARATDNPAQITLWREQYPDCNFGVACGPSGLIVIDVEQNGTDALLALELQYGLPNTFTVSTPRGGKHYYFFGQSRNRVQMLPNLDIRSTGGYVLAPGSVVNQVAYTVVQNNPISQAPSWLIDLIGQPKTKQNDAQATTELDNLPDARRAALYLSSAPPAISGNGGDLQTYKVCCAVRDLGISPQLCLSLLLDHYNPRCQPPWEAEALETKIKNAYKYATNAIGLESVLQAIDVFSDETSEDYYHVSMLGHTNPPREWIAQGWIPQGATASTLLTGDGGTGKSLLALQLAVAVALGDSWLGQPTKQMPVLFLTCEDDKIELDRRLYSIRRAHPFAGLDQAPLVLVPRAGKESLLCVEQNGIAQKGPFYANMAEILRKYKRPEQPGLWIIDTIADVYAGNENIRSAVNGFLKNIIGGLALQHNTTPLLIAHPSKQANSTYAGNTAWHNSVRNRLFLRWIDPQTRSGNTLRALSHEKSNYGSKQPEILIDWIDGLFQPMQEDDVLEAIDFAVLTAITEASDAGQAFSNAYQSSNYIGRAEVKTVTGTAIRPEAIKNSVNRLLSARKIEIIQGQKKGNGLFPAPEV